MGFIVSINVGLPTQVNLPGKPRFRSAIFKKPVKRKVFLDYLGFEGDGVADQVDHGGADKAISVYVKNHYAFWENEFSKKLSPGAFGENLTVEGLTEKEVCIGDVFRICEAEVQCSQPREPCHKLSKIFDRPEIGKKIQETGFSGFYLRVLKQGWVKPGAEIKCVQKEHSGFSVYEVNKLLYSDKKNCEKIQELLQIEALSADMRELFKKRLAKINPAWKVVKEV